MTVTIHIFIVGYGLAPKGTTLELNMVSIDTSVYDVNVNTVSTIGVVFVFRECTERKLRTVADASQTL
jgi:hypothetical protein